MKTAIGFNLGKYGDLAMNTVAARSFKENFPDYSLSCAIAKKFSSISPLFENHPYFDDIVILEGYDDYPTKSDLEILKNYDLVFNGMPQHKIPNWYNTLRNQTESVCINHGLPVPVDLSCEFNKYFRTRRRKKTLAFAPFGNYGKSKKSFDQNSAQKIVDFICKMDLNVIQVGHKDEPCLKNVEKFNLSYFDSVKLILSCDALITCDTGLNWVMSGYKHPVIGFYFREGLHPYQASSKTIQPINPNSQYFEFQSRDSFNIQILEGAIKNVMS